MAKQNILSAMWVMETLQLFSRENFQAYGIVQRLAHVVMAFKIVTLTHYFYVQFTLSYFQSCHLIRLNFEYSTV